MSASATHTALDRVMHQAYISLDRDDELFLVLEELSLHIREDGKKIESLQKKKRELRNTIEYERCVSANVYDSALAYVRHKKMKKHRANESEEDVIRKRVFPTMEQWDIVNPNTL